MENIKISLCASASRPLVRGDFRNWERFAKSLKKNEINYEIIFVGHTPCPYPLPEKIKWIHATTKPAQCYQIAFLEAKGELIHWTADDADYNHPNVKCPNALDLVYNKWKQVESQHNNDKKTVIAMNPCEDGGWPQRHFHFFFGGWNHTPRMAPFGVIHREYFVDILGGYDADFVSGQSENDVVMRVFEDGGRVEIAYESKLYVHHHQVHPSRPTDNKFREWYPTDRQVLEDCWIPAGYGNYEKENKNVEISKKRLRPIKRFERTSDICTVTQGLTGRWS